MGSDKLRIVGLSNGVLELNLGEWTVSMLREEVAKRSGCGGFPQMISLIASGKILKDGDGTEKLSQLGIKNNSKVMATRVSADQGKVKQELLEEAERCKRLSRLKFAATALVQRHADGSAPIEDFNLELENQSGEKVQMGSETDHRTIMMGLMLHTNAMQLIKKEKYKDALEVLNMGEEAFSLCDPKVIELVDNVAILQIDMVWCYFMLRDIRWLAVAGERLAKAREGLERAHGKESIRMRLFHGRQYPELTLHLRLELLEGVVAFHSCQFDKSRDALSAAQQKYLQLEVPDEALALLTGMGYKESDAKRALRMSNQDVESSVDFLVQERVRKAKEQEKNLQRQKDILEQRRYGMTPHKKAVDLQKLKELVFIGFEKPLAAEALRRNENDTQKALDYLTNPRTNAAIQADLELRKKKRLQQAQEAAIQAITNMGFPRAAVAEALRKFGTNNEALNYLLAQNENGSRADKVGTHGFGVEGGAAGSSASGGGTGNTSDNDERSRGEDGNGIPGNKKEEQQRDVEMEDEITAELQSRDAFSDYEIDVTKEGEAINEYFSLLSTTKS